MGLQPRRLILRRRQDAELPVSVRLVDQRSVRSGERVDWFGPLHEDESERLFRGRHRRRRAPAARPPMFVILCFGAPINPSQIEVGLRLQTDHARRRCKERALRRREHVTQPRRDGNPSHPFQSERERPGSRGRADPGVRRSRWDTSAPDARPSHAAAWQRPATTRRRRRNEGSVGRHHRPIRSGS